MKNPKPPLAPHPPGSDAYVLFFLASDKTVISPIFNFLTDRFQLQLVTKTLSASKRKQIRGTLNESPSCSGKVRV